ncbi:hypothetical protein T459_23546 [Capsicum annuum]|uniref:Uncharacterized protein n=1 Tax=Capsicum annuum TaxID=4072 RepID=A0A2G2YT04_CAPAN|nr:hypothetical protein T459_23546 [Capsicum annuum]
MNTSIYNINKLNKNKLVFMMGATWMGKSHLSVDLATHFLEEMINSDKMQVYKGLDIVTNKIKDTKKEGVKYYLPDKFLYALSTKNVSPEADYNNGIRRSIGVPAIDNYFREENKSENMLVQSAVEEIKVNTCNLTKKMWPLHHIKATNVFKENEKEGVDNT